MFDKSLEVKLKSIVQKIEAISSEINSENRDKIILDFLKTNQKATIKILASKLNLSTRAIEKQLANLKKENRVQRLGSAKKWEWVVNGKGKP